MQAPSFTLPLLTTDQTEVVSLEDFRGKPLMLTFWASWCPDSAIDLERKQRFYESVDKNKIHCITINVTGREADDQAGISYLKKQGYTIPALADKGTATYDAYQCMGVPTTLLIDEEQNITRRYHDKATFMEMMPGIHELIGDM